MEHPGPGDCPDVLRWPLATNVHAALERWFVSEPAEDSVKGHRQRFMNTLPCVLCCVFLAVGTGCRVRRAEVIEGPVFLYASASDCALSRRSGPGDGRIQGPDVRGVVQEVEPGTTLRLLGEDFGKDSLCYHVLLDSVHGYALASRRVRLVQ
jgi:hypothetical protein